jgi:hypothetical protein
VLRSRSEGRRAFYDELAPLYHPGLRDSGRTSVEAGQHREHARTETE